MAYEYQAKNGSCIEVVNTTMCTLILKVMDVTKSNLKII